MTITFETFSYTSSQPQKTENKAREHKLSEHKKILFAKSK